MSFPSGSIKRIYHSVRQALNLKIKSYICKHHDSLQQYAMNPCAYLVPPFPLLMKHLVDATGGGMSLFTALKEYRPLQPGEKKNRRIAHARYRASLTVETAAVLPMTLFFFLTFFAFFHTLEVQTKADVILAETAKELAVYGYDSSGSSGLLNAGYVELKLISGYSDSDLERDGVRGNYAGLVLLGSEFPDEEQLIKIRLTYAIENQFPFFSHWDILGGNYQNARVWNGAEGETDSEDSEEEESENTVYVTENGTVYHKDPNCTYLNPSIKTVSMAAALNARNRSGGKYKECELCGASAGGTVYITTYGDRYHSSMNCSGLKRTVYAVPEDEVNLPACSKCGGG